MGRAWVYRRPAAVRRRRFVPHVFAANYVVVRRRARHVRRRRYILRRRPFVASVPLAATGQPPILRRMQKARAAARIAARRAVILPFQEPPPAPGFSQIIRTIQRQRRKMKERLRPKPAILRLLELPPEIGITRFEQTPKLRTFRPGLYRGIVHGEGVRG